MAFGHGPTRREEQILALWENGDRPSEIAAKLGISPATATNIIHNLGAPGNSRAFDEMVARGSAQLLAAIHKHLAI